MDSGFTFDSSEFQELTLRLTGKEMLRSKKKALRKGSVILARNTRSAMRTAGFRYRGWMNKAIAYKVRRTGNSAVVHLFGDISKSGKDRGVVRYLEVGTRERYRSTKYSYHRGRRIAHTISGRKKGYSGSIKGYDFFEKSRNDSENQVEQEMSNVLESEIRKISSLK